MEKIIALVLIVYGFFNNPLKDFNARRFVLLGIGVLLYLEYGILPLLIASLMFLLDKRGNLKFERLWILIPLLVFFLRPEILKKIIEFLTSLFNAVKEVIESIVLRFIPGQANAFYIGLLVIIVIVYLFIINKRYLKRKLG